MTATPDTMTKAEFSRLLAEKFDFEITPQALGKAPFIPRNSFGKVLVQDALLVLSERGRIKLDLQDELPLAAPAQAAPEEAQDGEPKTGRPRAQGGLQYEQTLTEQLKRRKLQLELDEKEGKLLRTEDVTDAMVTAGRRIGEAFDQLPPLADEIVAVARTAGAHGVRDLLRRQVRVMREQLAEALTLAATEETEDDTE
jgi:hypothetical protein